MSSHTIKKPNGGVAKRRVLEQPDPNENLVELWVHIHYPATAR